MVPEGASFRLLKAIDNYNQFLRRYQAAPATSRYQSGRVIQGKAELRRRLTYLFRDVEDAEELEIEGLEGPPGGDVQRPPDDEDQGQGGGMAMGGSAAVIIPPFI